VNKSTKSASTDSAFSSCSDSAFFGAGRKLRANSIPAVLGNFKNLPAILLCSLFFVPVANAANYYVATNGSDSNPGTLASPWKTITKAANTLVAGDAVSIRGGTYREQILPKNSGSASAGFIAYAAYPGETVTVDGSGGLNNGNWSGVFSLSNRHYIQVSGLRFINSPGFGVYMNNSTNVRVLNNYTNSTAYSGVYAISSDTVTVDGNEIVNANTGFSQESISMVSTNNFAVSNNRIHEGNMEGIDAKVGATNGKIFGNTVYNMSRIGIYVDGWDTPADTIEIYRNTVFNSKSAASGAGEDGIRLGGERSGNISNVKIYNNILYNLAGSGVFLANWTESGYSEPKFTNISIYNNTAYKCGFRSGGGIGIQGSQNSGILVRNNVISQAKAFNIQASSGTTISNNLFEGGSAAGTSPVAGNPLFADAVNSNFHLQSSSPAINTGTTTSAPTTDFDLNARPQGGQVDIGAFEYGSSSTPPQNTPSPSADTTAPSAPATLAASAPDASKVNLTWKASTDNVGVSGYKIYRNGAEVGSSSVAGFTDSSVAGGTSYNYTTKAYDAAGNLSAASNTATVQTPAASSNLSISAYYVSNINLHDAVINWTTNLPSNAVVYYGRSTSLDSSWSYDALTTSHSMKLNYLWDGYTYYYKIVAKDKNGATYTSPVSSFKTRW